MEISKCFYCKQIPTIIRFPGDLFYAQCSCGKHGLYNFIGATRKQAIEQWNAGQYSRGLYITRGERNEKVHQIS